MKVIVDYLNGSGLEGHIELENPNDFHHSWYSGRRNHLGKYERHDVTYMGALMKRLKKCKIIKMEYKK